MPILCDNTSIISLFKYTVHHSRANHIVIKHHFIRDHVECGDFALEFIDIKNQLVDIFTKFPLKERFYFLRNYLGVCNSF